MPWADEHRVADDQPAGLGHPRGLEHHRARHVAAAGGDRDVAWPEAEQARVAVQHRAEDRWRVETRQAEPLDRAAWGDECARLAVRQERVLRDRRERAASVTQEAVGALEASHAASVRVRERGPLLTQPCERAHRSCFSRVLTSRLPALLCCPPAPWCRPSGPARAPCPFWLCPRGSPWPPPSSRSF